MSLRIPYWEIAPEAVRRMMSINAYLLSSAIEPTLRNLVWLRVSQINGCAYCVKLHSRDALREGETAERLNCLIVWEETTLFTARERAALAWAEALTNVTQNHAHDDVYGLARQEFDDKALVDLTLLIASMNAWNRMAIGFRRDLDTPRHQAVS